MGGPEKKKGTKMMNIKYKMLIFILSTLFLHEWIEHEWATFSTATVTQPWYYIFFTLHFASSEKFTSRIELTSIPPLTFCLTMRQNAKPLRYFTAHNLFLKKIRIEISISQKIWQNPDKTVTLAVNITRDMRCNAARKR